MDRRKFLQGFGGSAIGVARVQKPTRRAEAGEPPSAAVANGQALPTSKLPLDEYTLVAQFKRGPMLWKAFEDLSARDGALLLISDKNQRKLLTKSAEATRMGAETPYLGLTLTHIAESLPDVLAQRILQEGGDPNPELVKSVVPPIQLQIGTFIGIKECWDTQPVHYSGSTATYLPVQNAPVLGEVAAKREVLDGLLGGWLPAIRKVFPLSDGTHWEVIVFPDVERRERFIVHTWHRTAHIENGKIVKVFYGHTYPPYPPRRRDPKPEEFYRALLLFAEYWEALLGDFVPASLPQNDWVDMSRHSFVKELMTRPGGVYPKYGAVDRIYAGSEHDGFPDTFTNAVYANLEWGRFETAKSFIENYFDDFVESNGMVNYRGPETGQYGLILSLLARYFNYTRDAALVLKYRSKLQAIAGLLTDLQEESLRLPQDDPGYGLIHGWSEADSCLLPDPPRLWQPYFGNSALAARGFRDLGGAWQEMARAAAQPGLDKEAQELIRRSDALRKGLIAAVERSVRRDMTPPYVGALPGMKDTFDQASQLDPDGPQFCSPRAYIELLQADILPPKLANLVIDCMLAYGGTTLGIPGGWRDVRNPNRSMLAFISYGYAQTLLRLNRIEEFLLFLYAHRYHCHTRGHWTAAETAGIARGPGKYEGPYCTPAQQAVPLLVRWMLALEDSEAERLYLGRGLPSTWVISGKEISIEQAPSRWGRINFRMNAKTDQKIILARLDLQKPGAPRECQVTLRLPEPHHLQTVTINGTPAGFSGSRKDTVVFESGSKKNFEIVAHFS
jgi:hypothetical protein